MLATLTSAALVGIDAVPVQVEVNANERGEPRLILLGLPDAAVKESANRVHSALAHCGFAALRTRTTVNLAPGALPKEGALYDLPIALALLAASRQLQLEIADDCMIAGELSLSGSTRPIRGALAIARLARKMEKRLLLLPGISAEEAALVDGICVQRIDALGDACQLLSGGPAPPPVAPLPLAPSQPNAGDPDFSEIKGQRALRRAIEVACSGMHNLLMLCLFHPFRTICTPHAPYIDGGGSAPAGIPANGRPYGKVGHSILGPTQQLPIAFARKSPSQPTGFHLTERPCNTSVGHHGHHHPSTLREREAAFRRRSPPARDHAVGVFARRGPEGDADPRKSMAKILYAIPASRLRRSARPFDP